jgi:hypothetical protein
MNFNKWDETAHRKPPVILKIVRKPAMMCTVHWTEKQRRKSTNGREEKLYRNTEAASGTLFRISKFFLKEQEETLIFFFYGQIKNFKTICACSECSV